MPFYDSAMPTYSPSTILSGYVLTLSSTTILPQASVVYWTANPDVTITVTSTDCYGAQVQSNYLSISRCTYDSTYR